jgi:hypothetical protein
MIASRQFNVTRRDEDDWFDTILNSDTRLFIDPFLIFKEDAGFWAGAHADIIRHFDHAFLLIAQGNLRPDSLQYRKAVDLLEFPEAHELCLGYTATGTRGAGGGEGYAETIAKAIADAIRRGLEHPRHFEELGILNEGIGRDRISDITATILKPYLIRYTADIAQRHGIPVARHRLRAGAFDSQRLRWDFAEVDVPTNPFGNKPLLFVPQRVIRELPTLNAGAWWSSYEDERLRQDLNYHIMGKVDKRTIVEAARENPDMVRAWMTQQEGGPQRPYDLAKDSQGVYQWDEATLKFADQNPLALATASSPESFFEVIDQLVAQFKLYVEQQGGWSLLWNDNGREKPEDAAQLLFKGIVHHYCRANNIVVDREVELGRGPVDFKFSNGYEQRAHLEIKKVHNGRFWDGIEEQLPIYMRADEVSDGWFLALQYRKTRSNNERARDLPLRVRNVASGNGLNLRFGLIDASRPPSASKVRRVVDRRRRSAQERRPRVARRRSRGVS